MEELESYKDIYDIAKPIIEPIISTFLKPKIESLSKWLNKEKLQNELVDNLFENKFEEYLLRTYQKCYYINTIVFPNQQIKHSDIYFPVTLISTKDRFQINSNQINESFLEKYKRVLISDYAGMGKSTLSKFLCNHAISNKLGLPVFIELRKLDKENDILTEIFNQIDPIDHSFDKQFILKIISRGDFIFILDGFDEISLKNQEFVIKNVRDFITKASKNHYIITSRPEASLASFGDFQNFFIKRLQKHESFKIIDKYDQISSIKISKRLKQDIDQRFDQIKEFLTNPSLISLLYKSYSYNKDIPSKRVTFYEEVFSALYKAHDLSKDGYKRQIKSQLDIQDFRVILRELGFQTAKLKLLEYNEQELIQFIKEAKSRCVGIVFKESNFLEDLLLSVPLIIRDGNKMKWAHKSIQDYFAAEFICYHQKKREILEKIYDTQNEAFLNILVLFQELDSKTFRHVILLKLLDDFIQYYDNNYNSFSDDIHIKLRKQARFGIKLCFLKTVKEIDHDVAIEIVEKTFPFLKDENFYSSLFIGSNFYILHSLDFKRQLTELLYSVDKDLFVKNIKYASFRNYELLKETNKPELVDDSITNSLNNPVNFTIVNDFLINAIRKRHDGPKSLVLDIEECRKRKKEIEAEINKENEFSVLDGI